LPEHVGAFVEDIERATANNIRPDPWQTDTCIGDWHYKRSLYDNNGYKTVAEIVTTLADVVSKNGNLMLNIPLRGDGTIDDKEEAFIAGLTAWMDVNSEGIYASRPWKIYGEGPSTTARSGGGRGRGTPPANTSADIRFTTKSDSLYAYLLALPTEPRTVIKSLATNSPLVAGKKVADVSLLGYPGKLEWTQDEQGLAVKLPDKLPSEHSIALRIQGIT
jgi:alpha-L-fucosidase